ncbi:MAG: DNA-3-methyladenine glycosylase [Ruminococcus sp.]|nr:DNA-3-methyladenine glycosylase [Ruminococcus sp.]
MKRLDKEFFHRDCLEVAPDLVGKIVVSEIGGEQVRVRITETEAYRGEEDTACHAHKGRTKRTEVLYGESGTVYVYLCYGMHWLMNVVTGEKEQPQAVLFRAGEDYEGPARLTKRLGVTGEQNKTSFVTSKVLWIEDDGKRYEYTAAKRVGINYAAKEDIDKPWRFILKR